MEEDLSNMSLSELRLYLRKLREDVFPPASHPRKARVVKDIKKLKTISASSAGMEAVVVARKSMKKPIIFEEVEEDGVLIRKPVEPLPTYELPCHLRQKEKEKAKRRAKKVVAIEEPPTEIISPVIPEKPKKERAQKATKKEIPEPAPSAEPAQPTEQAQPAEPALPVQPAEPETPSWYPKMRKIN